MSTLLVHENHQSVFMPFLAILPATTENRAQLLCNNYDVRKHHKVSSWRFLHCEDRDDGEIEHVRMDYMAGGPHPAS